MGGRWGADGSGEMGVGRREWGEGSEEMGVGRFPLIPLAHSHLGTPISIHKRKFIHIYALCIHINTFIYTYTSIFMKI